MFTNPEKNLRAFGLSENMLVADLGAGTGFYSILAAHMVPNGKVYAVEIQKDFLHTIAGKAKEVNLKNIEYIWGNVEKIGGTKIADGILDAVIASNIFSHIEEKDNFIQEVKRILKVGGRVLLIDKIENSLLFNNTMQKIPSKDEVKQLFIDKDFIFLKDLDTGAHHYGIILKREK